MRAEKAKSAQSQKLNIPKTIPIDLTPELYQVIKNNMLQRQHPIVRPYLNEFIKWLKGLDALTVYDSLEKGETVREKYKEMRLNPIRITVAAARGLLKSSPILKAKAEKALSLELARLVLRFENPKVYQVLIQFDKNEEFLRRNIQATKEIFGLIEVPKD